MIPRSRRSSRRPRHRRSRPEAWALLLAGVLVALPLSTATAAARTVVFDDPELRSCVAVALGQPTRSPVTLDQARSITSLECDDQTVSDLGGIGSLTNLRRLDLALGNRIDDLAPLAGLTRLQELVASRGAIRDLSPLRGLTNLTRLDVAANPVVSLAPLASLTRLQSLDVGGDGGGAWVSLEPLRHLPLTRLGLGTGSWTTLAPLQGKTTLRTLELGQEGRAVDVAALGTLGGLRELGLELPRATDLAPVGRLTGLTTLRLDQQARNLAFLRPLRRLQVLSVVLPDADGSPLAGKPDLRELTLSATRLADLDALRTSTRLTRLWVVGGRLADVGGLRSPELREVLLTGVDRADLTPLGRLPRLESLDVSDSRLDPLTGFSGGFPALTDLELRDDRISSLRGFRVPPRLSSLNLSSNALTDLGALRCGVLVNATAQRIRALRAHTGRPYDLRLRSVPGQRVRVGGGGSRWTVAGTAVTYARPGEYRVPFVAQDRPDTSCDPGVSFDGVVTQQVVDAHPLRPPRDR